jgi:hypothetical protein
VRKYTEQDYDYIRDSLLSEGFTDDQMTFETDETFITDIGFFAYRIEDTYPRLTHFFVDKDKRRGDTFRKLSKDFWGKLIDNGHLFYILEVPKEKPYIEKFVKFYGGNEPFKEINGDKFYLVPTFRRIKK